MKKLIIMTVLAFAISSINAKDIKGIDTVKYANIDKAIPIAHWMLQPNWFDISEQAISIEEVKNLKIEGFEDATIKLQAWMFKDLDKESNNRVKDKEIKIEPWMMQSIRLDNESPILLEAWMFK